MGPCRMSAFRKAARMALAATRSKRMKLTKLPWLAPRRCDEGSLTAVRHECSWAIGQLTKASTG